MSRPRTSSKYIITLAVTGVLVVAVVLCLKLYQGNEVDSTEPTTVTNAYPGLSLKDPQASYQVVHYVFEQGGDTRTRELAINWLDLQSEREIALKKEKERWLMGALVANGHAKWDKEYRFWIFNSAFNVLQLGREQEAFTRLLQKLALEDPEKTMRLYALQHIELQRGAGNLTGTLAEEIRIDLHGLAKQSDSQTAGTALTLLINWEGPETPTDPELIKLALEFAEDVKQPVDIRITAIHAVGEYALTSARALAADTAQPILVRKASIAIMGRYGGADDVAKLESLNREHFRITQASRPALLQLRKRLSDKKVSQPVRF